MVGHILHQQHDTNNRNQKTRQHCSNELLRCTYYGLVFVVCVAHYFLKYDFESCGEAPRRWTIRAVVQYFAKPLIIDLTSPIWNEKPHSAWTPDKKDGILHASSDISMRL